MNKLTVAIIQNDIAWGNKDLNYAKLGQKIATLDQDIDLIILPEMFNTGFIMNPTSEASYEEDIVNWMYNQVKDRNSAIVGSAATFTDNKIANRLYFVTSEKEVSTYDKNHLFIHAGEDKKYTKGDQRKIIQYKGFQILLTVCFDLRFPVFNCNNNEYDILLNVACWPESRRKHWQALLKARAIENQVFVIACNRVGNDPSFSYAGDSMIIDYNGGILAYEEYKEAILIAELNRNEQIQHREKFNFLACQDNFTLHL
ncbi:amidohydrolase [Allofrancisella guangzhouensis]|uniref:Omega-amidase YafV n=1 Tax=Allofrancisella guangzhouensis TaxID=594679 RepID=A0A0A8E387_9GAMM|nr:nitrilase-related carbon-nitrogen hydrolase [Allofrancisella guangzhouensis]AJC48680.1 carbon-nitrogen hydrolase [Allofrancisella guangzhouensis]MBK2027475.1 amidohydrolase [Allofrancisella guangzhouensis]MBK2044511.1 amidohydrolase [Allofrancisella guangzhouensis]MBK2045396.1 amidohydrolase [Allofrancisella guangzhouensis]